MKPAPIPWIGCGAGAPPEITGDSVGSTANTWSLGHAFLSTRAQPVMWPPVPTPVISMSGGLSPKSARISCAVVRSCTVDIGGIVELLRHPRIGGRGEDLLGPRDRALHAVGARGEVEARAIGEHQAAALDRHRIGHHQDQLVALDRGDHRQADAGVAAGRLDDRAAGFQLARFLGVLDHRQRDAVLDRPAGIGAFGLDPHLALAAEQAVDPDARRYCRSCRGWNWPSSRGSPWLVGSQDWADRSVRASRSAGKMRAHRTYRGSRQCRRRPPPRPGR